MLVIFYTFHFHIIIRYFLNERSCLQNSADDKTSSEEPKDELIEKKLISESNKTKVNPPSDVFAPIPMPANRKSGLQRYLVYNFRKLFK